MPVFPGISLSDAPVDDPVDERGQRGQGPVPLFAMRGVAAPIEDAAPDRPAALPLDRFDLAKGSVRIVDPLRNEHRNRYGGKTALDVPGEKSRIEPGPVPTPEGAIDVPAVVPLELRPQVGPEVFVPRLPDGAHGDLLAEDVRRLEQQAADPRPGTRRRRVQQGDRAAVAVPDEKSVADARLVEKVRKGEEPLVVHVGERSRKRDGIGSPVPGAAVDESPAPRPVGERPGEVTPRRGAPDPVVQEDERGSGVRAGAMPGKLDAAPARNDCPHRSSPCRSEGCRAYVL